MGLTSAFEHTQYKTGEFEDWIGAVHILGPSTEFTYFHNDGYIRLTLISLVILLWSDLLLLMNIKKLFIKWH